VNTQNGQNPLEGSAGQPAGAPKVQEGMSPLSFDDIYRQYSGQILNLLYRFTSREQVARDLLQDVFVKVYENLDSFEQRSQVYTWIYRIAVNHALNHLKRERRNLWVDLMDETVGEVLKRDTIEAPGFGASESSRPDEVFEREEKGRIVKKAIDSLPPNYRIPFLLYKDEHLSYAEIAQVLEIGLNTAASRIHRARKMLIKRLGPLIR
jgi:RNA polymerase sigma-70 factor (ECF subfamily)